MSASQVTYFFRFANISGSEVKKKRHPPKNQQQQQPQTTTTTKTQAKYVLLIPCNVFQGQLRSSLKPEDNSLRTVTDPSDNKPTNPKQTTTTLHLPPQRCLRPPHRTVWCECADGFLPVVRRRQNSHLPPQRCLPPPHRTVWCECADGSACCPQEAERASSLPVILSPGLRPSKVLLGLRFKNRTLLRTNRHARS